MSFHFVSAIGAMFSNQQAASSPALWRDFRLP